MSFSLGGLRFIDSLQFLSTSLDSLVKNLPIEDFKLLTKFIENTEKRDLMLRKGVYPYDYVDSAKKLDEDLLPSKADFFQSIVQ